MATPGGPVYGRPAAFARSVQLFLGSLFQDGRVSVFSRLMDCIRGERVSHFRPVISPFYRTTDTQIFTVEYGSTNLE